MDNLYLSQSDISRLSMPLLSSGFNCGVYFLLRDKKVVYVGQSRCAISSRIDNHVTDGKVFDSYYAMKVDECNLDIVESFYIHTLRPEYNADVSASAKSAPIKQSLILDMLLEYNMEKNK